uniref:RanBP2-type domain-containing protein n=1 Tax=Trypanosoma congolense (strain IL3000) TaxID=1068625 RepID=G0UJI1_TRYCI|nr:conserved hypothetical protein [Trypanosoma congolense IL3000]
MLKPPFIRQGAVTRSRRAVPLEYGILSGCSSSRSGVNVQVLSELKAKSRWGLSTSPSLAIFVYNSLALRLLINEGILYNIVSTTAVSVKSVLQLLHPAPRFPSLAARGKAAGSDREEAVEGQEAVRQLVWSAQKEYASFVRGIMPESLRPTGGRCGTLHGRRGTLRWSLREVWDCTAAVFKDFVRQDDLLSLQLLLPVAQCISADDKEGRVLQGNLESLLKHRAHGGVLWLLWRFAGPSKRANSKFLEAAVMAVCEVATSDLLQLPRNVSHRYEFVTVPPPGKGEDEKQLAFFMKLLPVFNVTSRGDCFSPFWRLLLYEMVRYAHLELLDANAEPRAQVGALQSLRRIICSFRRHGCVLPILFLHEVITSSAILLRGGDGAASESLFAAAASGRYGPLVYREILLLDAYALMTVGHVGETADDVGENVVGKTVELQARCAAHLNDLEQSNPGEGSDRDIIGLHRGARAAIEQRLQEAIRVSFKLLLRCGAYEVIERQMQNYPSLGGSWEGGKALVLLGKYTEAVDIFSKFLVSTRSRFAGGLPHHIRDMVLGALEGASRHYCNEGGEALASLLRLYDVARTWKFPLPPAVAFAAIVRGCTSANGESLGRLELLRALLNYHTLSAVYRSDGLLSCVVKLYVHLLGECRNVVSASFHFELLSMLDRAHPGLFVCRVALLHFLDVNYDEGVNIVLRRLVDAPACPVTRLKPLQEMPRAVLDTLQRHIEAGALGKYAPSVFDALRTAIEYRRCVDMQRQPWRCCACGCWNPRGAPACKHCGSLELAVVQCGLCGGFSPTNSLYCPVCGTETLERNVGDRCELVPREGCTLYPLRQWRCGRCNHKNEPRHLFYCARCASPQPIVEHALAHTAFLCTICNHHNPLGMLRPWCPRAARFVAPPVVVIQKRCGIAWSATR